jgi:hypothetical protein
MNTPAGNASLQLAVAMAIAALGAAAFVRSQASVVPMDIKPGLWMVTDVIQGGGGGSPAMPDTSGMSDAEKKMAASMMNKMQQAQAPHKDEICIAKDQGTKPVFQPDFPENPKCKRTAVKGSADSQDSTFDCPGSTPRSGTLHVDRDTDETAHGTGTIDMKSMNASYNFTLTAKWLRAECKTK